MDKYIGKLLDNRYELLEEIGTGGMSVVYRALCHRLNRYVAVKILKEEYLRDDDLRRRFHNEAQAVAMMSHPNIVSVYDVSTTGNIEYIVMELIDGVTLKQYMRHNGVVRWKEVVYFASQTAQALRHAHSRGIIHRDIKPHNIMILRDGTIKVADFGIARLARSNQNTLMQETLGSVHYVSPEQARGAQIDARTDIYSLGVVMYEMLTGKLPFDGDSPVAIAMKHINSVPAMPREIEPSIPKGLEYITMKAMEPSLNRRYASAEELLNDLEKFRHNPDMDFSERAPVKNDDFDKTVKFNSLQGHFGNTDENKAQDSGGEDLVPKRASRRFADESGDTMRIKTPRTRGKSERDGGFNHSAIVAAGVVGAFFVCAVLFAWISLMGGGKNQNKSVSVPQLVGKLYNEVITDSEYIDNFKIIQSELLYHETMPDGTILSQSPEYGKAAKKGDVITVTVSRGQKSITLTDLSNFEYRQAMLALSRLDLLYKEQYQTSDKVAAGYVITTDPAPLSEVHEGDVITIIISQGKTVGETTVPNVINMTEMNARLAIENAGLTVGVVTPQESDKADGIVLSQSIKADTIVDEKTKIDLTVSMAPIKDRESKDKDTSAGNKSVSSGGTDISSESGGTSSKNTSNSSSSAGTGNKSDSSTTTKNTESSADSTKNESSGTSAAASSAARTDGLKQYNLPVNLERFSGEVRVTVKFNGQIVYDDIKNADVDKLFFVPLYGNDTGYVYLYIDNQSVANHMVSFD